MAFVFNPFGRLILQTLSNCFTLYDVLDTINRFFGSKS